MAVVVEVSERTSTARNFFENTGPVSAEISEELAVAEVAINHLALPVPKSPFRDLPTSGYTCPLQEDIGQTVVIDVRWLLRPSPGIACFCRDPH